MLEVRNIVKAYEGKPLLRGISFSVAQGETICLLGASGSGKSTLLRMIAGLEFPESGQILFNQIDLAQTPPHLRDFGLVFQDYGLFPHLNIFDNVAFGLKMKILESNSSLFGISRQQAVGLQSRVAEMLDLVNLTGFENRKVTDLSGGEQQRVALARALAPSPRLLMFDEPLGALDKSLKEDLLNQIRAILHKTKIPAIYVTHDQDEAFTVADRILLLHDGEIIRDGAPDEVWNSPNSVQAARMLGMGNVIEGVFASVHKVKTEVGIFTLNCKHRHSMGESISLLLKQSEDGDDEIQLKVEDVLFDRDQFQVKTGSGLVIHMKNAPKVGEIVKVKIKVECLA
ncbi:ABC transporter ATP-binding protein [Candidatus Villigracilis saccharophilus]|uniref:ABC transporter ATP-binding protein n=1 Tax=Candidatus Villigracilis saccharophilus TaxID=3140684 RepID=UPI0031347860|nr:ABC transporter ATP-binding protein [Anaerolineales bacterium]